MLSALDVYVFVLAGAALFLGALSTLQGALIAATAPFAGVVGAVVARRLRLAAFGAGGELPAEQATTARVPASRIPVPGTSRRSRRNPAPEGVAAWC
jgi:hypothetical protein